VNVDIVNEAEVEEEHDHDDQAGNDGSSIVASGVRSSISSFKNPVPYMASDQLHKQESSRVICKVKRASKDS
jgi:hypothetical protein